MTPAKKGGPISMRQLLHSLLCLAGTAAVAGGADSISPETVADIKSATVYIKVPVADTLATGSGWVMKVEGETGYLVTNHHVIADAPKPQAGPYPVVTVVFNSGTQKEQSV